MSLTPYQNNPNPPFEADRPTAGRRLNSTLGNHKEREVTERKSVYLEEYLAAHKNALKKHPRYRPDMMFTQADTRGNLVFNSRDKMTDPENVKVLEEVVNLVALTHKLIVP